MGNGPLPHHWMRRHSSPRRLFFSDGTTSCKRLDFVPGYVIHDTGKRRPKTPTFTISEASSSSSSLSFSFHSHRYRSLRCLFVVVVLSSSSTCSHLPFHRIVAHVYNGRPETLGVGWNEGFVRIFPGTLQPPSLSGSCCCCRLRAAVVVLTLLPSPSRFAIITVSSSLHHRHRPFLPPTPSILPSDHRCTHYHLPYTALVSLINLIWHLSCVCACHHRLFPLPSSRKLI